jgi:hypothetical protein
MKITSLLFIVALVAVAFALFAWAAAIYKNASQPHRRPVIGNANRKFFRRHMRKVYLAPLLIARIAHWFGLSRLFRWLERILGPAYSPYGSVQFANIGEGTEDQGVKTYIADAATSTRYLLYKKGTDTDHSAIAGLNDVCLGPSDDQADAGVPIAINLLGVKPGLIRVQTDGTISDGDYVKSGAVGQATKATTGDAGIFGIALIGTDASKAAGDVIAIQHVVPSKLAF